MGMRGMEKSAISLLRTFIYDSLGKLDDFAKKCRGLIGKTKDYVCEELL